MNKTILLTRPKAASERLAQRLSALGYPCAIAPLTTISRTDNARPQGAFQAILLTSANAAATLRHDEITDIFSLPCLCVGAATGEAAKTAGFANVLNGASDGAALAELTANILPSTNTPLLHISGEHISGTTNTALLKKGFTVERWITYRATAATDFTPQTRAAFAAGNFAALPVFSPRTAEILVSIIEKNSLAAACQNIVALGLSQQVTNVLQKLSWKYLSAPARPDEEEMIHCLRTET